MKKRLLALLLAGFMIVQTGTAVMASKAGTELDFGSEEILTETTDSAETEDEIQMDTADFQDEDEIQMENEPEEDEASDEDPEIEIEDEEMPSEEEEVPDFSGESDDEDIKDPEIADYYISKDGNWKYFLRETGNAVIAKYMGTDTELVIPAEMNGHPVTELGEYVFAGEYHSIPGYLLGYYDDNKTIVSLTLPSSLEKIDLYRQVFTYLSALEKFIVDSNNKTFASKDGVLFYKDTEKTLFQYPRGKKDKNYTVPEDTVKIYQSAISENPYLKSLDLNHAVNINQYGAVSSCDNLERVDFGDSCTRIADKIVLSCKNLKEIELPNTLTELSYITGYCQNIATVKLPKGGQFCCEDNIIFTSDKKKLVYYAPAREGTEYRIPDSVTELERGAFLAGEKLETLVIPAGVSAIGSNMIYSYAGGISSLKKVVIYNPDCYIYDDVDTIAKYVEIWGYDSSTVYEYAMDYGRTFVNLKDGTSQKNEVTWQKLVDQLPTDTENFGEPVYQTQNVVHESDPSKPEYVEMKAFTDDLVKDCKTDYEKVETISKWVHNHITYRLGAMAGNTIDSVYSFFYQENPTGNCMAYTRLTAYMLYMEGIGTVEAVNATHEWCMARLNGTWYIIDSTNNIITSDYSMNQHKSPEYLSFSKEGNVYAVKSNAGIYLCRVGKDDSATTFVLPDYVNRIQPNAFTDLGSRTVTARSSMKRRLKRDLECITMNNDGTITARWSHDSNSWGYISNDSTIQKRTCRVCKETEQRVGPMQTDACWTSKSSYTEVVGKTISLKVYNISKVPIYYRSSNPAAASVSGDGKVTLKKGGKAIIYAYTKGNGRYRPTEMQISIQVVDLRTPKITAFKLTKIENNFDGYRLYFTVTWKGVANADYYQLCCNNTSYSGYHSLQYESTGAGSYTGKYYIDIKKGYKGRAWVSACNKQYGVHCDSTIRTFDRTTYQASLTAAKTTSPKTSITSLKNLSGKKMQIKWKKKSSVTGYQIQYATNKKFTKGKKTVTISSKNTTSKKISKLKKKKTYYVRIRTYKKVSGKKYYSGWSTVKKIKIRK